jgi:hypothetical protein
LLVVSSALGFTPFLLFACGPLVLDSKRALDSVFYLCTHFFFSLSWEKMLVVRKQWMSELGLSPPSNFDPI